jgi:hypothetical protein
MVLGRRAEDFPHPVPEGLCRAHLNRILSSATLARAEQLRRLLEWLGDRSLSRFREPPSEKEIGETVLERPSFDPQTNSLVRKEMSRLRKKLAPYYAREGARERIRIHSAGGGPVPFYLMVAILGRRCIGGRGATRLAGAADSLAARR